MTTETPDRIADGRQAAVGSDPGTIDGRVAGRDRATAWRSRLTVVGWLLAIAILIVSTLLWARSGFAELLQVFMTPLGFVALLLLVVTQASAGVILAVRRPDNVISSLVVTFALAVALAAYANGYLALAGTGVAVPWHPVVVAVVLSSISFSVGVLVANRHELFSDPAFIAELDRHIRATTGRPRRGDGGD